MNVCCTKAIGSAIASCLVAGFAQAQSPYYEKVEVPSATSADFADIYNGTAKPQAITLHIYLPPSAELPYPVVVAAHGSGGIGAMENFFKEPLLRAGFAYVVPDSFGSRDVASTGADQGAVSYSSQVADALYAFKYLSTQSRFDPLRIGLLGYSRGGMVANMATHKPLVTSVVGKGHGYIAFFEITPACNVQMANWKTDPVRFYFALGEKDDLTPAHTCNPVIEKLKAAGADVTVKRYDGGYHGFANVEIGKRWVPKIQKIASDKACPIVTDELGVTSVSREGIRASSITVGDDWPKFVNRWLDACGGYGAYIGSEVDHRDAIKKDVVTFFATAMPKK